MLKNLLLILYILLNASVYAQNIAIGQWQDRLSYREALWVTEGNGKIYALTSGGITVVNKSDNSIDYLSKVNALSDVQPLVEGFNTFNNKLFVAYGNSNIDIIESDNSVINMLDFKLKFVMGSKTINHVYFMNQYAYVATALGVLVIDMDKYVVKETYVIGEGGVGLNIRAVTSDDSYIYAATDSGVYRALLNSINLSDYASWIKMPGLPNGSYNFIVQQSGKIYTNKSKWLKDGELNKDSVFVYQNGTWSNAGINNQTIQSITVANNQLVVTNYNSVNIYNSDNSLSASYTSYIGKSEQPKYAIIDKSGLLWIADYKLGLVTKSTQGFQNYYPEGPESNFTNALKLLDEKLYVAPGNNNDSVFANGIYRLSEGYWKTINGNYSSVVNFDTLYNINQVYINPYNTNQVYASSLNGLIEIENDVPVKLYNKTNSPIKGTSLLGKDSILIGGIAVDQDKNVWVTNAYNSNAIHIKKNNGSWESIDVSAVIGSKPNVGPIIIDKQKQKWVVSPSNGILVYKGDGEKITSDNVKLLSTESGRGALPSKEIYCMVEDMNGHIWVGTQKGVAVFFSPGNIFSGNKYDAEKVYVQQDGSTQLLLETESVQAIAIDGANRKWFATSRSGVFLMSSEGTKQIYHFTESNSPLLSNNVKSIAINPKNGEVFFATDKGIVSFRSTATEGNNDYSGIYAFPNPVKPDYTGTIAITGLMENSTVKITDINGRLMYETESLGGQAIWDGKIENGERVSSGVYMVFCTNEDGTKKASTKIVFVK